MHFRRLSALTPSVRRWGWMKNEVKWFYLMWISRNRLMIFTPQTCMTFQHWFKHAWFIYFGLWESFHSKNITLKNWTCVLKTSAALPSQTLKHAIQRDHFQAIHHFLFGSNPTVSKFIFTVFRDNSNHIIHRSHVQSISTEGKWNFSK